MRIIILRNDRCRDLIAHFDGSVLNFHTNVAFLGLHRTFLCIFFIYNLPLIRLTISSASRDKSPSGRNGLSHPESVLLNDRKINMKITKIIKIWRWFLGRGWKWLPFINNWRCGRSLFWRFCNFSTVIIFIFGYFIDVI